MIDVSKKLPDGPIYADFVEYVKDSKTFADREYEQWLADRVEQSSGYRDVNGYPATFGKRPVQLPDGDCVIFSDTGEVIDGLHAQIQPDKCIIETVDKL